MLLAKYDLAGGRIWARKAGAGNGGAQDRGLGVSIAPDQSVYQVGQFLSATHTNASTVLTNRSNPGFADGFVAKYDAAGALQWLRQIGSTGLDVAESVAATVNGDILVAGQLSGTNTIGTNVVVSSGGSLPDACIVNYDASGGVQWVRVFGGAGSDAAMDIAADPRGNIYITGFFQGTATFGSKSVESIAATKDVFVAGVRPDGTVEFVQQAGGDSIAGESGLGVAVDVNGGGVHRSVPGHVCGRWRLPDQYWWRQRVRFPFGVPSTDDGGDGLHQRQCHLLVVELPGRFRSGIQRRDAEFHELVADQCGSGSRQWRVRVQHQHLDDQRPLSASSSAVIRRRYDNRPCRS